MPNTLPRNCKWVQTRFLEILQWTVIVVTCDTRQVLTNKDGKISRENAQKVATQIKQDHSVFKSVTAVDAGEM